MKNFDIGRLLPLQRLPNHPSLLRKCGVVRLETKSSYDGLWGIYETAGADPGIFDKEGRRGRRCKLSLEIFKINQIHIKGRERESDKVVNSNLLAF